MKPKALMEKILRGGAIGKGEALALCACGLQELSEAADEIRQRFCGNRFDLCAISNGKSGRCSEDCKYCAQSSCYQAEVREYPLAGCEELRRDAQVYARRGVLRYSVVTSGKRLNEKEFRQMEESYRLLHQETDILLCASHGLLSEEQFRRLKRAGVIRYHNNLETSRRFFPSICTTHTFEEKLSVIRAAQRAGLQVCSGGIMGLGESWEDRIDLALTLRELGIQSVPINILNPIYGTPLAENARLKNDEVCRIAAIYRFLLPHADLRLAGGRRLLGDQGAAAFRSGANAAITGDMLTTDGIEIKEDTKMIEALGYEIKEATLPCG